MLKKILCQPNLSRLQPDDLNPNMSIPTKFFFLTDSTVSVHFAAGIVVARSRAIEKFKQLWQETPVEWWEIATPRFGGDTVWTFDADGRCYQGPRQFHIKPVITL